MTKLFETAIEAARQLSAEDQDELAHIIMAAVNGSSDDVYVLSDEELAAVDEGLADAERGDYASNEEVAATFALFKR